MEIVECFEGDDLEFADIQREAYFGRTCNPDVRYCVSTPDLWLMIARKQARRRLSHVPWIEHHAPRIEALEDVGADPLRAPHDHMAAFARWVWCHGRLAQRIPEATRADRVAYRFTLWRSWLYSFTQMAAQLVADDTALVAMLKTLLDPDAGAPGRGAGELDEIVMAHYGMACVARTWRARDPRLIAMDARYAVPEGVMH